MTYAGNFDTAAAIIGEDFENHGGELVVALAKIKRLESTSIDSGLNTRKRLRLHVELATEMASIFAKIVLMPDAGPRLARVVEAANSLADAEPKFWLADCLTEYFGRVRPVSVPVDVVEAMLRQATERLNAIEPDFERLGAFLDWFSATHARLSRALPGMLGNR